MNGPVHKRVESPDRKKSKVVKISGDSNTKSSQNQETAGSRKIQAKAEGK